ncbi:glycoside hydrolase family 30 beta sandwich domain-containing protein [Burkholderia sp. BCC0419]|uniref:glycoside hydrolase family 30 protein n=1 Tax=Burkholderia sp. BCC0419 TaxID=486878 RepID=UPI0015890342|nr:glycoside hydrolase family 30 beta sandwich domain-containing protein [Burkholderia sp. BCC0419]
MKHLNIFSSITAAFVLLAYTLPAVASPIAVSATMTTADQSQLLAAQPLVHFGNQTGSGTYTIQVSSSSVLQPWDGVGAAMTDSAATVLEALPASQLQPLLRQLFTPSGAGFNMVRLPMGASDMSASGNYSYDDMPAGQTDPALAHFSIAHDQTAIIPLLQNITSLNTGLKLLAEPWSPPAWMKTNGSMKGVSGASSNTSQIIAADFPYLANYFVKFIQAYAKNGLSIHAVSPQNEPLNTQSGYPSAILTASDEAGFIANDLRPALANASLGSVKIFGLEDNYADTAYAQTLLGSNAASYLAGTSFHWYSGSVSSMQTVQNLDAAKGVWLTESTGTISCPQGAGNCPTLTGSTFSASGFKTQMQQLVMGVPRNGGRGILGWNLALNEHDGPTNGGCYNCVGVVTVDSSTSPASIYYNTTYYTLAHIGGFVAPGANVISTTTQGATGIQDVGFANPDGTFVLVAFNGGSSSTTFTVAWNGQTFDYTLPASAAVTFKW